jgi:hypothetical protein
MMPAMAGIRMRGRLPIALIIARSFAKANG